ncbi:MAG: hypothetical protein QOF69_2121 [Solirubrobacteraceae bacterium]|nr:hypothetical protein [Solirubrobacteraceae bacterium]
MSTLMNQIILGGGTGCLDPALYDHDVAGYGASIYDVIREDPQPSGWRAGQMPSWCEIWLGRE